MYLALFLIACAAAANMILHVVPASRTKLQNVVAVAAVPVIVGSLGVLALQRPNFFTVLIAAIGIYQIFNIVRILKGRMHAMYLWHVSYRTSLWLIAAQFGLALAWMAYDYFSLDPGRLLFAAGVLQLLVSLLLLSTVRGHARRMRHAANLKSARDADLPSVTVAIPARNETDSLHECIQSLLASDYPKLEILVLDDCSQTTRTPEIIRSFAHQGVRFIQGTEPSETWLPKNQAYQALASAASGELLLFAGVDIRFTPGSIRQMVAYATLKQKEMLCLMPRNDLAPGQFPLIQPMRYVWELALPRRIFKRPPVLSSCWMISKRALTKAGGFKAAARMVVPESYLARKLQASDGYGFVAGGDIFGISSAKDIDEQRDTAVRVSYPQTHRRPEMAAVVTFGYVSWVCLPLCLVFVGAGTYSRTISLVLAGAIAFTSALFYTTILRLAYGKIHPMITASFPFAALVYVALLNYSMYKYEFSEVLWKGRNVCIPVMHVIPRLPKI